MPHYKDYEDSLIVFVDSFCFECNDEVVFTINHTFYMKTNVQETTYKNKTNNNNQSR